MVLGFIIAKISSNSWRLLHSTQYPGPAPSFSEDLNLPAPPIVVDSREERKESVAEVVRRIQIEYTFQFSANFLALSNKTDENNVTLSGLFRICPNDPFTNEQIVVWKVTNGIGYALICDPAENLSLAEYVIDVLIRLIIDNITQEMTGPKILLEGEKIVAILHVFLPSGTLLFMNHRIVRHLEKDVESILSAKY